MRARLVPWAGVQGRRRPPGLPTWFYGFSELLWVLVYGIPFSSFILPLIICVMLRQNERPNIINNYKVCSGQSNCNRNMRFVLALEVDYGTGGGLGQGKTHVLDSCNGLRCIRAQAGQVQQ